MRTTKLIFAITPLLFLLTTAQAQTTAFNYQGRLTDGGSPANGAFQMQFKLFDALAAGNQIGSTLTDVPVTVSQGVFSVKLDFGIAPLSGANRWIEIAVRHSSSEFYTTLSPREQITSSPYAVRTISAGLADNALALGGIPASEYVTTSSVGSAFIRNGSGPIQSATFNISGSGLFGSSVGIGTTSPAERFHLKSQAGFNAAALVEAPAGFFSQYQLKSGANNPWIIGTQDNFSGGGLLFRNGGTDAMTLRPTGNVGIGTTTPTARLTINGTGLNGYSLGVSGDVGIGGNVTQTIEKGGTVKAMLFVIGNGIIFRCYNGLTGASLNNGTTNMGCGFSVNRFTVGSYGISFGFPVNDRFVSVTPQSVAGFPRLANVNVGIPSDTTLNVFIVDSTDGDVVDDQFHIVVF